MRVRGGRAAPRADNADEAHAGAMAQAARAEKAGAAASRAAEEAAHKQQLARDTEHRVQALEAALNSARRQVGAERDEAERVRYEAEEGARLARQVRAD
jgi:hypothetical protein